MSTYSKIFHVDLSDAKPEHTYQFYALGQAHPLIAHDEQSRAQARIEAPELQKISDEKLTHYTPEAVAIPTDLAVRVHVGFHNEEGAKVVHHALIHIPEDDAAATDIAAVNFRRHHHVEHIDWIGTAKTFLFHHPDLVTQDPATSKIIYSYMDQGNSPTIYEYILSLSNTMRGLGTPATNSGWARLVAMQIPTWTVSNGQANVDRNQQKTGYRHDPVPEVIKAAAPAMKALLFATSNDKHLENKKWHQSSGTSVITQNSQSMQEMEAFADIQLSSDNWDAKLAHTGWIKGLESSIEVISDRKIKITMNNYFVRYLCGYIQFIDADGNVMDTPDWTPDDSNWGQTLAKGLNLESGEIRMLGILDPITTILAIPDYDDPGSLEVSVTFPAGAVGARLYGCGLGAQGSNAYPISTTLPAVLTGTFNLGLPALFLAMAIGATTYKELFDIVEDEVSDDAEAMIDFIGSIVQIIRDAIFQDVTTKGGVSIDWSKLLPIGEFLFKKATIKIIAWIALQISSKEAIDEIPFIGWILMALEIATDIAQLGESIGETVTSPWQIKNSISMTINSQVTVHPDPRHNAFPQGASPSYVVKAIYKNGKYPTITQEHTLTQGFIDKTLSATFKNSLGGHVKFEVDFHLGDWLAAKAVSGWIANTEANTKDITLYLVQFPIPLNSQSIYQHTARLARKNGSYTWQTPSTAPTDTIAITNASDNGHAISEWKGVSLSQRHGMLGWAWRAADMGLTACSNGASGVQLYAMQNLTIPGEAMNAVKFSPHGFLAPTHVVYDEYPAKFLMQNGQWVIDPNTKKPKPDPHDVDFGGFYIDPLKASGSATEAGYHLRRVVLDDSTPIKMGENLQSWGRFPSYPDPSNNNEATVEAPNSIAIHPSGHVVAVNSTTHKLYILELEAEAKNDNEVPVASVFAGKALNTDRKGLLIEPIAVTCTHDGTILVLENLRQLGSTDARIQAFDLNGNPVSCFEHNGQASPFLTLGASNRTYLDVAAVGGHQLAYVYALYYEGTGEQVSDYHMSIYRYGTKVAESGCLVTTSNIAAAKLAVDMWHTVYTLNFALTTDESGQQSGHTMPSLSEWLPPIPQ